MEMHPKIAYLFQGREAQYPKHLEAKYSRVFGKIMDHWGAPEAEVVFQDLLLDKRGGRQGFPPEVMGEILMLGRIHDRIKEIREEKLGLGLPKDPWGQESVKRGLAREQISYDEKGFFRAVELGNELAISLFLNAGVNIESKNPAGWTPLIAGAFAGSEKSINTLLQKSPNLDATDSQGFTALHWAAFKGFPGPTKMLIEAKANVNAQSDLGLTPLHQAAMMGHLRAVDALIRGGAKLDVPNNDGWTPLHQAVSDGSVEIIERLVAAGADLHIKDHRGSSPVDIAKRRNKAPVLAALGAAS
jgi:ankyrin repeat protein